MDDRGVQRPRRRRSRPPATAAGAAARAGRSRRARSETRGLMKYPRDASTTWSLSTAQMKTPQLTETMTAAPARISQATAIDQHGADGPPLADDGDEQGQRGQREDDAGGQDLGGGRGLQEPPVEREQAPEDVGREAGGDPGPSAAEVAEPASTGPLDHVVAEHLEGVAGRTSRAAAPGPTGPRRPIGGPRRGPAAIAGCARSRPRASACSASSWIGPEVSSIRRASAGSVEVRAYRTASVATPSRRSVPGVLPDWACSLPMSTRSSASWKATPMRSPNVAIVSTTSLVGAGHHRAEPPRRGDQRAGLVRQDADVVRDRVLALARADRLADLAGAQPLERAGLDAHGLGAEVGQEVRGPGEQEVAGEDRHGVVPAGVGRGRPAAQGRLVHDVVVVERGQVGQLDDHGRGHDSGCRRVAELRGQQGQQRAEALAAGVHQMARGVGDERVLADHRLAQEVPPRRPAAPPMWASSCRIGQEQPLRSARGQGGHGTSLTHAPRLRRIAPTRRGVAAPERSRPRDAVARGSSDRPESIAGRSGRRMPVRPQIVGSSASEDSKLTSGVSRSTIRPLR